MVKKSLRYGRLGKSALLIVTLIILSRITPWAIPLVVAVVVRQSWKFRSRIQRWDMVARCVAILGCSQTSQS